MKRSIFGVWVLSVLAPLVSGCGPSGQLDTVKVNGQLTVDGQAAGPMMIVLTPQGEGKPTVNGYVKADGSFTLTTYTDGDGAPEGSYKVSLGPDPMSPASVPQVKETTVQVTKSDSGPLALKVELTSSGSGEMVSPLPQPGKEGGGRKSGSSVFPGSTP